MKTKPTKSTFVLTHPSDICEALVGLKDIQVLSYQRWGPRVELMIERVVKDPRCPTCFQRAHIKERPVVNYIDLPVYGVPMQLAFKKHRMICINPDCGKKTWYLSDHRIAAKNCRLTKRAQMGNTTSR